MKRFNFGERRLRFVAKEPRTKSCKDPQPTAGALLSHKVHLVLAAIVDPELCRGGGGLCEDFAFADTLGVAEEFFLEVLGDPALDDDVVAVPLIPLPGEVVGEQGFGKQVLAVDLERNYC